MKLHIQKQAHPDTASQATQTIQLPPILPASGAAYRSSPLGPDATRALPQSQAQEQLPPVGLHQVQGLNRHCCSMTDCDSETDSSAVKQEAAISACGLQTGHA